jgi:hypothetical protein
MRQRTKATQIFSKNFLLQLDLKIWNGVRQQLSSAKRSPPTFFFTFLSHSFHFSQYADSNTKVRFSIQFAIFLRAVFKTDFRAYRKSWRLGAKWVPTPMLDLALFAPRPEVGA